MRQPRRGIANAIKAITPATVPPMIGPVSITRIVKVNGIECFLVSVW